MVIRTESTAHLDILEVLFPVVHEDKSIFILHCYGLVTD